MYLQTVGSEHTMSSLSRQMQQLRQSMKNEGKLENNQQFKDNSNKDSQILGVSNKENGMSLSEPVYKVDADGNWTQAIKIETLPPTTEYVRVDANDVELDDQTKQQATEAAKKYGEASVQISSEPNKAPDGMYSRAYQIDKVSISHPEPLLDSDLDIGEFTSIYDDLFDLDKQLEDNVNYLDPNLIAENSGELTTNFWDNALTPSESVDNSIVLNKPFSFMNDILQNNRLDEDIKISTATLQS